MDERQIDPRYAAGQLAQSLRAAQTHTDPRLRAAADARAKGWIRVLEDLAKGLLRIGHRQPFEGTPVWVTPGVMRGGFASRAHAAGGALQSHERAIAQSADEKDVRLLANGHFLTPAGLATLG